MVVTDVRNQVESALGRLIVLLADSYLARRKAGAAIPQRERALRLFPELSSVTPKLILAYELEGRLQNAARLRQALGSPPRS